MISRVPLAEVETKVEQPELPEDKREQTNTDTSIDEMQDLSELSVMMGFEHGFDGESPELVYQWAKNVVGEPGGPKVLAHIKEAIRLVGANNKGPALMRKLNMYATLDSKQAELQLKKENLML